MAKDTPGRGSDQFPLRFPDGMRDQLKKAAKENNRSLNAEIIARLENTLSDKNVTLTDEIAKRIQLVSDVTGKPLDYIVNLSLESYYKKLVSSTEIPDKLKSIIPDLEDDMDAVEFEANELQQQLEKVHTAYAKLFQKLSDVLVSERENHKR